MAISLPRIFFVLCAKRHGKWGKTNNLTIQVKKPNIYTFNAGKIISSSLQREKISSHLVAKDVKIVQCNLCMSVVCVELLNANICSITICN